MGFGRTVFGLYNGQIYNRTFSCVYDNKKAYSNALESYLKFLQKEIKMTRAILKDARENI
jgi:hypothetical protein